MPSILDEAADIALETALMVSGQDISYERGAVAIPIEAIPGDTSWDEVDAGGIATVASKAADWLFPASAIAALGKPVQGDIVRRVTDDSETLLFSVMSAAGEQPWRFADRNRKWIRVHTKQTG